MIRALHPRIGAWTPDATTLITTP